VLKKYNCDDAVQTCQDIQRQIRKVANSIVDPITKQPYIICKLLIDPKIIVGRVVGADGDQDDQVGDTERLDQQVVWRGEFTFVDEHDGHGVNIEREFDQDYAIDYIVDQ